MTHEIIAEHQTNEVAIEREKTEQKVRRPLGGVARHGCFVMPNQSEVNLVPDNGEYPEAIDPPRPTVIPNYPA